jgi:hypothetical protein
MVAMVNDDRHSPRNNGSDVSRLAVLSFPPKRESKFRQSMAGCPHRGHDRSDPEERVMRKRRNEMAFKPLKTKGPAKSMIRQSQ